MGGVGGDVSEEWLLSFHRINPSLRLTKKDVGAETVRSLESAIVEDRGIEIFIAGRVAAATRKSLSNTAPTMDEHFFEAAFVGPTIGLVAQVPFAKNARCVASRLEHLRQRGRL
jgi:hypothetical protein